ncbi:hypothetical protein HELRODRAFT_64321 [Helobdella robusta]|uniref:Phosphatidylinositol transfer protein N-terminal domain-containing protein n=1 Tax=Helobdella robusta TaxID=6412 RepID=T1FXS8_HELRO|nr:hypothetical protein HELRODRAFT_64321 [Helobdella robusta]ESO05982.1 hypothetical protein HELRODRAFT_64321 [Helobdella robusta]
MLIKEFRIVLPMTVDEYQVAQLYSVAHASKNETGGGEGIEVLKNEPFSATEGVQPKYPLCNGRYTEGQYTLKIYHLASKVPNYLRWLAPKGSLEVREEAWNAFPYCRTIVTNPEYMKDNFFIKIESIHLPDRGDTQNAHGLDKETLSKREVIKIDIANDAVDPADRKPDINPSMYKSVKTGRGPLAGYSWDKTCQPVMCCYKLVTVEFKWWGLQSKVEKFIQKGERRIFTNFHREVFCWTDEWFGLTMADIRALEDKTKKELDQQLHTGEVKGTKKCADDD